jgi:hypothetical protein
MGHLFARVLHQSHLLDRHEAAIERVLRDGFWRSARNTDSRASVTSLASYRARVEAAEDG